MAKRWAPRTWKRRTVLPIAALVGALIGNLLLAFLDAPAWWIPALTFGAVAVLELAVLIDERIEEHQGRLAEKRERATIEAEGEADWQRQVRANLKVWPAPLLSVADPFDHLGVARTVLDSPTGMSHEHLGAYIPRAVDKDAVEQLRGYGYLLLIGDPGDGVTRTAYEAALANHSSQTQRRVIAPKAPHGAVEALSRLNVLSHMNTPEACLLWLDRIEDFAGITQQALESFRSARGFVVATSTVTKVNEWRAKNPELKKLFREPVFLRSDLTPGERRAAESLYPGTDFTFGIGAAFTGLASLQASKEAGDDRCPYEGAGAACPLSRQIVEAAIVWAGAGTPRPLTLSVLARLIGAISGHGQQVDDHLRHALRWATHPVKEHVALLTVTGDGQDAVVVNATLAELDLNRRRIEELQWDFVVGEALEADDIEAAAQVGYRAHLCMIHELTRRDRRAEERRSRIQSSVPRLQQVARTAWASIPDLKHPAAVWLNTAVEAAGGTEYSQAAIVPLQVLLDLTETAPESHDRDVAGLLTELGVVQLHLGDAAIGLDLHQRALTIREREFGAHAPEVAESLVNLASCWNELGYPAQACELNERAVTILEREYGSAHRNLAPALTNLGNAEADMGHFVKARLLHQRALTILEREYGGDAPQVADAVTNLGVVWARLGNSQKALECYQRALTIVERHYGGSHPRVAVALSDLGAAWADLDDPAKARDLHRRALAIFEHEYGPEHPYVALSLNNLGVAWNDLENFSTAHDILQRALAIRQREYGADHDLVATTLMNLGVASAGLGRLETARDLYQRALAIREREYGQDHLRNVAILRHLGSVLASLGRGELAAEYWLRALRILRRDAPGSRQILVIQRELRSLAPDVILLPDGSVAASPEMGIGEDVEDSGAAKLPTEEPT